MKIISLGKAKYRLLTLRPIIDNNKNILVFSDYPISLIKCLIFSIRNKSKAIKLFFCDGKTSTINSKILNFFFKKKNTSIIWFNSSYEAKEEREERNKNIKNLIFFPEQIKYQKKILNFDYIISYPKKIKYNTVKFQHSICYISEVKKDIDIISYPNLFNLDKKERKRLDDMIWHLLKKNKLDKITNFDFIYNIFKNYHNNKNNKIEIIFPEIYSLIKNRIRFLGIKKITEELKDKLILIGKSWKDIGFKTFDNDNDYNYNRNIYIYKTTKIPIDFGSLAGEYPIYLRTYEILKNSNWIMQSKTRFSKNIYQKFLNYVTFNSIEELLIKIKNQLKEDNKYFDHKKKKFCNFLINNNKLLTKKNL